jgi:hypothetical protein
MSPGSLTFPVLRWVGLLWMVVWLPAYFRVWGWANLLHLCDVAVILTFVGIWLANPLLLSSQAVGSLAAGLFWILDAGWRLTTGRFLVGGTDYMWDARYPLWVRLLSTFHVGLPLVLLWTPAQSRLRPARAGVPSRDRSRASDHLALLVCGAQLELRLPRSPLPSRLGPRSGTPSDDLHPARGAHLLAHSLAAELAVSRSRSAEMMEEVNAERVCQRDPPQS